MLSLNREFPDVTWEQQFRDSSTIFHPFHLKKILKLVKKTPNSNFFIRFSILISSSRELETQCDLCFQRRFRSACAFRSFSSQHIDCKRTKTKSDRMSVRADLNRNRYHMSRNFRKHTFGQVRPVKIQIRLRIRAVWSESSLGTFWITKFAKFLRTDNKDWSDCAHPQADLSLRWVHMWEGMLSQIPTHISYGLQLTLVISTSLISNNRLSRSENLVPA